MAGVGAPVLLPDGGGERAQRRMPTYLRGDPTRDGVQLYRWLPVTPLRTLTPTVQRENGHTDPGHLRVPLLIENE